MDLVWLGEDNQHEYIFTYNADDGSFTDDEFEATGAWVITPDGGTVTLRWDDETNRWDSIMGKCKDVLEFAETWEEWDSEAAGAIREPSAEMREGA
jgi:hypothetical protein